MSGSRKPMATDPTQTEMTLHDDPRLLPGVAAVVKFVADRAGFAHQEQERLAAAIVEACRETFSLLDGGDSPIKLVVADLPECVQVTIEHSGSLLPTAGLDSFAATAAGEESAGISGALLTTGVDRVKYDTHGGRSRMTLIKYCPGAAPKD